MDLQTLAKKVLAESPDPLVQLRLLGDVLQRPGVDPELRIAQADASGSHWLAALKAEQKPDGSWGRLHSQDSALKRRIPTTEFGVRRALAIGLARDHPVLENAASYLARLLAGEYEPPDRPEKSDRWPLSIQLFAAATLALIQPRVPILDSTWETWLEIARRSFESGRYDPDAEVRAHQQLTGASVRNSFLVLSNRYSLELLSSRSEALPDVLEKALLDWIWCKGDGVGYYDEALKDPPASVETGRFERWLVSLELMSRFRWSGMYSKQIQSWFSNWMNPQGRWDLGSRASWSFSLPLSESWRRKNSRGHDWTTRILLLLQ